MTLFDLKKGETAVVKSIKCEGALRRRLLEMGVTPKTTVTLHKIAPLGDPIEILIRGYNLTLRQSDAKNIVVEAVK